MHLPPEDRLVALVADLRRHIKGETERLEHTHRFRRAMVSISG